MVDELRATYEIAERRRTTAGYVTEQAHLHELQADRPAHAPPTRRRAVARWLGDRLIAVGERLGGRVTLTATPDQ